MAEPDGKVILPGSGRVSREAQVGSRVSGKPDGLPASPGQLLCGEFPEPQA